MFLMGKKKTPPYDKRMMGKGIGIGESVRYRGVYPVYPFYDDSLNIIFTGSSLVSYIYVAVSMARYTSDS